ncbi:N-acetylneuraminate synthase family protein [Paenibacillus sp. FSL H8-0034]|uniref:N-acetylneuraminate synthase family protein n=1 Tax=Paenibacillus sp. FSL H8-0034 TaxID=2954671 RepID=UPI0030F99009
MEIQNTITFRGSRRTIISAEERPYIIAEIGSNHNQNLKSAKELIQISAECGADAVKFQSLDLEKQYAPSAQNREMKDLFHQIRLQEEWYPVLAAEANCCGVDFFSAPTYLDAIPLLEFVSTPFYKLASPQIRTFPTLIRKVASLQKPVILSVGYCNYAQIERAVQICLSEGNEQIVILHCVSEYPTKFEQVHLRTMTTLGQMFDCPVGLSDHTPGYEVPVAAVALGAVVIEKHITLNRSMDGPDHFFAMEPEEFKQMVQAVKHTHLALGSSRKVVTKHESEFANSITVRWFAGADIDAGRTIAEDNIVYLRDKDGISDENYRFLGFLKAKRPIKKGEPIRWTDVSVQERS